MCIPFRGNIFEKFLSDSIRVVQRFLVPFVLVRIQVGQQKFNVGSCFKQT